MLLKLYITITLNIITLTIVTPLFIYLTNLKDESSVHP